MGLTTTHTKEVDVVGSFFRGGVHGWEVSRHTLCPTQSDGYAITLPSNPPVGGNRTGHKEYVQDHVCNGRSAHVRKQRARQ